MNDATLPFQLVGKHHCTCTFSAPNTVDYSPSCPWHYQLACALSDVVDELHAEQRAHAATRHAAEQALKHAESAQEALSRDWRVDAGLAVTRCIAALRIALSEAGS